ncbi:Cell division control protein 11, partial [Coemansia sp. RSA 2322]
RYPWGTIEIDDEAQCDFALLRYILLNSHIADLINYTIDVLYENYRTKKLEVGGYGENEEEEHALGATAKKQDSKTRGAAVASNNDGDNSLGKFDSGFDN